MITHRVCVYSLDNTGMVFSHFTVFSFLIQLLKCWGANVTATCSRSAIDFVSSLGADCVVNYDNEDLLKNLKLLPTSVAVFKKNSNGPYYF